MEHTRISHYAVGRRLGRGGSGEVYEARDLELDRLVALKFVAPELAADSESLKRFEREARAAAALKHLHIATLYAFERDGDRSFIAMELVGGGSLRDRLREGPCAIGEALAIARATADALAHAHRREVVHRDVKPENLMFDEDGVVKLMDFGLARALNASRMTTSGSTLGTAAYMPPEALRGAAGGAGDVFALGVTLHEMLTGELPFSGDSPLALLYSSANEDPKPLRAKRPDAPAEVEALLLRMLEKDPALRPSALDVARTLSAMTGAPAPALPAEAATPPPAPRGSTDAAAATQPSPAGGAPHRRRMLALAVAGGVVALVGLAGPAVLRERAAARRQEAIRLTDEGVDSLQAGNAAAAQARFEAALRLHRDHGAAAISLGAAHHARGDDARAAQVLRQALARHADDPALSAMAYWTLAEIDMSGGNWRGAIESLRTAFALDSSGARAYNQLAFALIRGGRPTEAIEVLTRGIHRFPGEPALHKNMGLAMLALGDPASAEAESGRALELDPNYAPALALRARARARTGDRAGARADWQRYLALRPSRADTAETAAELWQRGVLP